MALTKKLQVFVSSTYLDLREERQAAVEAILTAGHIPAGMELFTAGDESQMDAIKRWIDESDVYLLILGGRYGSVEPKSQKSYIQLEYEYAVEKGKPLFAVVIKEDYLEKKVKKLGSAVFEKDNPQKYKEFQALVLNKMVRFWADPRDIKLFIHEAMSEFSRREDLVGWIPGSEAVNTGALAEELARLTKENATLREQVAKLSAASATYNNLTFEQLYTLLASTKVDTSIMEEGTIKSFEAVADIFGDAEPGLLHIFWLLRANFRQGYYVSDGHPLTPRIVTPLVDFGVVEVDQDKSRDYVASKEYRLTATGQQFLLRLRVERDTEKADRFLIPLP